MTKKRILYPERESRLYRFNIDQYEAMIEAQILNQSDCVELLNGLVCYKGGGHPEDARLHRLYTDAPELYRFRRWQYEQMVEGGILDASLASFDDGLILIAD